VTFGQIGIPAGTDPAGRSRSGKSVAITGIIIASIGRISFGAKYSPARRSQVDGIASFQIATGSGGAAARSLSPAQAASLRQARRSTPVLGPQFQSGGASDPDGSTGVRLEQFKSVGEGH
jgi:hypothetical protein